MSAGSRRRFDLVKTIRFAFVGGLATLIYFGVTALSGSDFVGFPASIASMVGFGVSLAFSYAGHAYFTYRVGDQHKEYGPRFLIATAGLVIGFSLTTQIAVTWMGLDRLAVAVAVSVIYPPASFLLHSGWTFRDRR